MLELEKITIPKTYSINSLKQSDILKKIRSNCIKISLNKEYTHLRKINEYEKLLNTFDKVGLLSGVDYRSCSNPIYPIIKNDLNNEINQYLKDLIDKDKTIKEGNKEKYTDLLNRMYL